MRCIFLHVFRRKTKLNVPILFSIILTKNGFGKRFFGTCCTAMGILIWLEIFSHIPYYEKGIQGIFPNRRNLFAQLETLPVNENQPRSATLEQVKLQYTNKSGKTLLIYELVQSFIAPSGLVLCFKDGHDLLLPKAWTQEMQVERERTNFCLSIFIFCLFEKNL